MATAKELQPLLNEAKSQLAEARAEVERLTQEAAQQPVVLDATSIADLPLDRTCNVAVAIARVMAELPAIGKLGTAPKTMGEFPFRRIEDITAVIQKLMAKHGVVIVPKAQTYEVVDVVLSGGAVWSDTRVLYHYTIVGPDMTEIPAATFGVGRDNFDKGSGKAATTAYKILLIQTFCIGDSNMDIDGAESGSRVAGTEPAGRTFGSGQAPAPAGPKFDWLALGWTDITGELTEEQRQEAQSRHDGELKLIADALNALDPDSKTKLIADRKKVIGNLPFSKAQLNTWSAMADAALLELENKAAEMQQAFPGSTTTNDSVYGDEEPF